MTWKFPQKMLFFLPGFFPLPNSQTPVPQTCCTNHYETLSKHEFAVQPISGLLLLRPNSNVAVFLLHRPLARSCVRTFDGYDGTFTKNKIFWTKSDPKFPENHTEIAKKMDRFCFLGRGEVRHGWCGTVWHPNLSEYLWSRPAPKEGQWNQLRSRAGYHKRMPRNHAWVTGRICRTHFWGKAFFCWDIMTSPRKCWRPGIKWTALTCTCKHVGCMLRSNSTLK